MTSVVGKGTSCPVLIGRDEALKAVLAALAPRDGPPVVLVSGEAGVGKSRLAADAVRRVAGSRPVTRAASFEADRLVPLALFLDLLAAVDGRDAQELLDRIAAHARQGAHPESAERELSRRQLFDALAALLLDRDQVLVLEDLHWSDQASLEAVLHVARRATSQRLLITYREDEIGASLASFLAALDRGRLAVEVPLARLPRADVAAMAEALTGTWPRRKIVDLLLEATDGNPFFVEEVLGALGGRLDAEALDGDVPVPRTVEEAVRRRLDRLGPAALETAVMAAVVGRRLDVRLLAELLGMEEAAVVAAVRELIDAQVAVQSTGGSVAFRHELTRRAVYQRLIGHERRQLHRRVAESLAAADHALDAVGDLARHAALAGEWEQALVWAQRAGQRAEALYAPSAAVEQYERAVDAAGRIGRTPSVDLLQARARSYELLGELDAAVRDHDAALAAARAADDAQAAWQSLLALGGLWVARDWDRAARYLEDALAVSRRLGDPLTKVRTLNRRGNLHMIRGEQDRARRLHEEALALAETLDAPHEVAATLDLLAVSTLYSGDLHAAHAHYTRVEALFRELGDRPAVANTLAMRALCGGAHFLQTFVPALASADSLTLANESLRLDREIGWHGESFALHTLASVSAEAGRLGDALTRGDEALRLASEIEHRPWVVVSHSVIGLTLLDALAPAEALTELDAAVEAGRSFNAGVFLAFALAARARAQAALGRLDAAVASVGDAETAAPGLLSWRGAQHARAVCHLAAGEPAAALSLVDELIAGAPRADAHPPSVLALLRGEALLALDRPEAVPALGAALDAARTFGKPLVEWQALAGLAGAHAQAGRADDALAAAAAAHHVIDRLAAGLPAQRARQFRDRARQRLPRGKQTAPAAAAGGLTPRQREVAALLAQGLTNREIAAALVISPLTAETHVKHILTKLGLARRAQIAAWAVEHGLTPQRRKQRPAGSAPQPG